DDVGQRRARREDAQPAEGVDLLELLEHGGGDGAARDAVEAVAAGDVVALDGAGVAVDLEAHAGLIAVDAVQHHVAGTEDQLRLAAVGGGEQVFLDAGLAVGHEAFADVLLHVDEEAAAAGPDDLHAVVRVAFALHALGQAVLAQHVDGG